jgi:hypothetical protein
MRATGLAWAVITSLVVAGCGSSPPSNFYTLSSVPPEVPPPTHAMSSRPLVLGKLTVPSILDRPEIATRVTATRLEFSEVQRWAAPLDKLMRRALADDLAARMGGGNLLDMTVAGVPATAFLILDISEFDAAPNGEVTLDARWAVAARPEEVLPVSAEHAHVQLPPHAGGADDVPATMSQALAMLADRIVASLPAPRNAR